MRRLKTKELAVASILGGLSALCEIYPAPPFDIPFPMMQKITWDFTGIPIMLSLLLCNPLSAIYTSFVGCSVIYLRGNNPGWFFKITAELSTVIGFAILRRNIIFDTLKAIICRVVVMTIVNYYGLQLFYSIPREVVLNLLPPIAIFNITQALINIVPAYIVFLRVKSLGKI